MTRWRLDLAYDGAKFSGWASQPGLRTVQGELERWTTQVLRLPDPVQLTVAGRTDAGVHARGQVAHFDTESGRTARALVLGANLGHASTAFGAAPVSHGLFYGSILALEAIFFLYYTSWNLFQTLPAAAAVGVVAFLSGSRALSEVQERRLAGQR